MRIEELRSLYKRQFPSMILAYERLFNRLEELYENVAKHIRWYLERRHMERSWYKAHPKKRRPRNVHHSGETLEYEISSFEYTLRNKGLIIKKIVKESDIKENHILYTQRVKNYLEYLQKYARKKTKISIDEF
jgi:hypothetical protein